MPRLHLLGTGSGLLNPRRGASACLLEGAVQDVLLDAGEPVAATLARRKYDWSRLAGIVISHTHADHLGGLPMLLQQVHLSGRTGSLSLHAPPEFAAVAREHLARYYLFPEAFAFSWQVQPLQAGSEFELAGCHFRPLATTHLAHYSSPARDLGYPNRCEAFALAVRSGSCRFLYSGDVGSFLDLESEMPDAGFAIVDSTHIDLEAVARWAELHPAVTVVLSHVSPAFDFEALEQLKARFPGARVRLAEEGEILEG